MARRKHSSIRKRSSTSKKTEAERADQEVVNGEDGPQQPFSFHLDKAKEVTNLLAVIVALAYAVGFLITSIYLGKEYGIYDFTLIKARYVYSGITFLLFCFVAFIGGYLLQLLDVETKSLFLASVAKYVLMVIFLLLTSAMYTIMLIYFASMVGGEIEKRFIRQAFAWFNLTIFVFASQIWIMRKGIWKKSGLPVPFSSSVFTGFLLVVIVYVTNCYPLLPISLGGGRPIPIQMVADEEKISLIQQLVPIQNENVTETVYLVEQSPDSYFVLVNDINSQSLVHPVQIDKSLIIGVIQNMSIPLSSITPDGIVPATNVTPTVSATLTVTPTVTGIPSP